MLEEIKPFTYIKDIYNLVYYIERSAQVDNQPGYILSACVYHPSNAGSRVQLTTGKRYDKLILHGMEYERQHIKNRFHQKAAERVWSLKKSEKVTNKEFLFLPLEEVAEIYSPKISLEAVRSKRFSKEYGDHAKALEVIISLFTAASVPSESIGLYGGLQCFMFNSKSMLKDIDILIEGYQYYDAISRICYHNPIKEEGFPFHAEENMIWKQVVQKRRSVSQFKVPGFDDVVCDVRIISSKGIPTPEKGAILTEVEINNALVLEADKSLSIPYSYKVQADNKDSFEVISTFYHYLGAAAPGDRVNVKGVLRNNNRIEIIDPQKHCIHLSS